MVYPKISKHFAMSLWWGSAKITLFGFLIGVTICTRVLDLCHVDLW